MSSKLERRRDRTGECPLGGDHRWFTCVDGEHEACRQCHKTRAVDFVGWHVLTTKQHAEKRVTEELTALRMLAYLPLEKHLARHARQTKVVERALIPGYVFVYLDGDSDYHTAKNTDGAVDYLKNMSRKAAKVAQDDIMTLHLLEVMGEFDMTPEHSASKLLPGQSCRAITGQFQGHSLTLVEIKPALRALVTMLLFGRVSRPFEMDARFLEAA